MSIALPEPRLTLVYRLEATLAAPLELGEIARRNGLVQLSMGMSVDWPLAVQLGATFVRVGSAIFGSRTPRS